jgi:hypothetical protein
MSANLMATLKASLGAEGIDFEGPMPFNRKAFSFRAGAHYSENVFYSQKYIQERWKQVFDIVDIIAYGHDDQTVVVMRKS